MKKNVNRIFCMFFAVVICVCAVSCGKVPESEELWKTAVYTEDTVLGEGSKAVQVEVKAVEKSVTFTVNTDEAILGDALVKYELISGEEGPYGLYVKEVNGITADYDVNQSYWAFSKDGEYMMTGVDQTEISGGEHYELVYTKQ